MTSEYAPETGTAPASKIHIWILILLVWTAVFAMIAVGLILTKSSEPSISQSSIALACQNGAMNGITTNLTRISDACLPDGDNDGKGSQVTGHIFNAVDADGKLPALTLPTGWTAEWSTGVFDEGILATFRSVKGIYETCRECGGMRNPPSFSITAMMMEKADLMEPDAITAYYVEQSKADDREYTNIAVTKNTSTPGMTLITIDGVSAENAAGGHNGPFHIVRFLNATKYIELTFREEDGATNAEWEIVKNSLDWSTVK